MIKKHIIGFGAIIGLALGVISIVAGVYLPGDSSLVVALLAVESPLLHVVTWMHKTAHGWGSNTDLYKLLALVLGYWTLLGLLAGLGFRWLISRKGSHAA